MIIKKWRKSDSSLYREGNQSPFRLKPKYIHVLKLKSEIYKISIMIVWKEPPPPPHTHHLDPLLLNGCGKLDPHIQSNLYFKATYRSMKMRPL